MFVSFANVERFFDGFWKWHSHRFRKKDGQKKIVTKKIAGKRSQKQRSPSKRPVVGTRKREEALGEMH